jgi:hypothetical protein|tara:strand:+ start:265 stop:972 length:708 start_codon:yes stop_codon:yes gene_type:complete
MKNKLICELNKIASNKFLIQKYFPLLEISTNVSMLHRVSLIFVKVHYKFFNILYPKRPWTSPASILFFDRNLNNKMVGLEYGSGRSTFYFSKKIKHLVSIEHHEEWFTSVNKELTENNVKNVDYFLIPKENFSLNAEDKDIFLNEFDEYESKKNYLNYYNKVNEYPDDYFDFVLIDGRARVRCGLNAIKKLKSGGIFVLDNSERTRYKHLFVELENWPNANTTNGFMNTTIWIKP